MGKTDEGYFIIFSKPEIANFQRLLVTAFDDILDFAYDFETLLNKVEYKRPQAIFIIEDSQFNLEVVNQLRQTAKVDDVAVYTFSSPEDASKVIADIIKAKT